MKITNTNTKQILVGISVSLAIALSGCGSSDTSTSTEQISEITTLGTPAIKSRGVGTKGHPLDLNITSVSATSMDLSWNAEWTSADARDTAQGIFIGYQEISEGFDIEQLENADDINFTNARMIYDVLATSVTIDRLKPNTNYAFRIAQLGITDADIEHGDHFDTVPMELEANSIITSEAVWQRVVDQNKTLVLMPDPCLNVTGYRNNKNQSFSRWTDEWVFGAQPVWCFTKDERGNDVFDGANLYRSILDPITNTFINQVELTPDDTKYDSERDEFDCGLIEHETYRYTLQAYKLAADGVTEIYAENNVTADIVIEAENCPIRVCEDCK